MALNSAASGTAVVPTRYPADDPAEPWTLAKVIRRRAELLADHNADCTGEVVRWRVPDDWPPMK